MSSAQTLFIGGTWQAAGSGAEFATVDPATGQPYADCANAAVSAARAALGDPAWSGLLPAEYTASAGTSVGSGLLMASMLVS